MEDQDRQLVHAFSKSDDQEIRFVIRKFRGRLFADLRLWFKSEKEQCFLPTRKGISVPIELVGELKKASDKLVLSAGKLAQETTPER